MGWLKIDDGFRDHPKIIQLSDAAFRLHVCAMSWCAEGCTNGVVKGVVMKDLRRLVRRRVKLETLVDELVSFGLLERVGDDYVIHDFLDYNPSREQVLARRAGNRNRQQSFRQRASRNAVTKALPSDQLGPSNGVSNAVSNGFPVPSRPVRLEEEEGVGKSSGGPNGPDSGVGSPPEGCTECAAFGTGIGWNPRTRQPCRCALGRWRVAFKRATGQWPVGPEPPATGAPRVGAAPRGRRLTDQEQAELDALIEQATGSGETVLDQEPPL
jgi:hypothetical protein